MKKTDSDYLKRISMIWHPKWTGVGAATLLFLCYIPQWLTGLSSMGGSFAYDFFTLPRCGLALRNGTDLYTSSADYQFGYHATNWASHPALCISLGVPFSYLDPWVGFWLSTFLYFVLHCSILWVFGQKLLVNKKVVFWQHLCFASLGFFYPWYLNYHLGQYHLILVAGLFLALLGQNTFGFALSALGKPALAPAALCLFVSKKWPTIFKLVLICLLGYLPFLFLSRDANGVYVFGLNESFMGFINNSSQYAHFSVRGWDQEMGWSKVYDELFEWDHYPIRLALMAACALGGAYLARANLSLGIGFASLWFFFSYGRIHEYHYATFVPLLAWAASTKGFSPKSVAIAAVFMAAPTVWPLLSRSDSFVNGKLDFQLARSNHPVLFWAWLLHKPMAVLFVAELFWSAKFPKKS